MSFPAYYGPIEQHRKQLQENALFTLCYCWEALIPIEIGVTSYRVEHFDLEVNKQGLRCNLDLMDELRDLARIRQAAYNQRIARYYNR